MDVEDLSPEQLRKLDLQWVGQGVDRRIAYWRRDSDGRTLLHEIEGDELDELNTMIGNAASMEEIRAWLDERADQFIWQDQMDLDL
jgi:hypothetical protein